MKQIGNSIISQEKWYRGSFKFVYCLDLKKLSGVILIMISTVLLNACSKDVNTDRQLLSLSNGNNYISYLESGNLVILNDTAYSHTSGYIGIPVTLNKEALQQDTITAVIDLNAINDYNRIYGENNPLPQEGMFGVSHGGKFPIAKGQRQTRDSLYVILKNGMGLKSQTVYVVPVRLRAKKGIELSNNLIYYKMKLSAGKLTAWIENATALPGATISRLTDGALNYLYFDYPDSLKLSVGLNMALPGQDVIAEGTTLTEAQTDSANNAQYLFSTVLPARYYKMSQTRVTVPGGSLTSKDSLTIKFFNKDSLAQNQYYLIGVKLKHYKQSKFGVQPSASDSSIAYIRFFLQ